MVWLCLHKNYTQTEMVSGIIFIVDEGFDYNLYNSVWKPRKDNVFMVIHKSNRMREVREKANEIWLPRGAFSQANIGERNAIGRQ